MAFDSDLVADIRGGVVTRQTLLEISNAQATIRVWSGRGELTVDGVIYGGTSGDYLIAIGGISDTAVLQSHEAEITIDMDASRKLGLVGFSARDADVTVKTVFLAGDGSIRSFRKTIFSGKIQGSTGSVSRDSEIAVYRARPPLLDLSQSRMTRYTPPDQARRFGAADTGFDDVPGLVNKEASEWAPGGGGIGSDINVTWVASGGAATLTDTSGRSVGLVGTSEILKTVECGAVDRLGTRIGDVSTANYEGYVRINASPSVFSWRSLSTQTIQYYQLGYGSTIAPITNRRLGGIDSGLEDFYGIELRSDGFVYANNSKVVVNQSNNKIYSSDGFLIVMAKIEMVFGDISSIYTLEVPPVVPSPAQVCVDINQTDAYDNWRFATFDANQFLQAQVS